MTALAVLPAPAGEATPEPVPPRAGRSPRRGLAVAAVPPAAAPELPRQLLAHLEWMRQRGYSGQTISNRRGLFHRLRGLGLDVDQATPDALAAWRAQLTVSDRAVFRYMAQLRGFYAWAIEAGYRDDNPAALAPRGQRVTPAADSQLPGLLPAYLEWMRQRGYSRETISNRRMFLYRLGRGGLDLEQATPQTLAAWRAGLTVSDRSVIRYVSHLHTFYAWAIEAGYRDDNPAARIPIPQAGRLLPRPISDDDLADALRQAPPRIRLMLILAAWSGLRAKEIALLRRENVLDTAPQPFILVAANATKGRNERTVPLSTFVLGELRAEGLPRFGYVFPRADGQPGPNRPQRISHLCGTFMREAGIPATLHQLRHWFGTSTMRTSHDLRVVQELMGHNDPKTTAGYAAFDRASAAAAVEALRLPSVITAVPA